MLAMLNNDGLWEMSRDETVTGPGQEIYQTRCMPCHGVNMGGKSEGPQFVGEPLNDKLWKYGAMPTDIFKVVHDGSPDVTKGMPPWGTLLGPDRVAQVVSFVLSKHEKFEDGSAGETGEGVQGSEEDQGADSAEKPEKEA